MSAYPNTLPSKLPSDARIVSASFAIGNDIAPGETILSAQWNSTVETGNDPNAQAMISGAATISGNTVSQLVVGGLRGNLYALSCTATTSLGQVITKVGYMEVTNIRGLN